MRGGLFAWAAGLMLVGNWSAPRGAAAAEPIPDVGPTGEVKQAATGFAFTEGPAWDGEGLLYFTDVPNARIHTLAADGRVSEFVDDSGPCNGLMFNREGELVACDMSGRLVAWNVAAKTKRVLAAEYDGQRFNAPNDLVIDAAGGVYFTDPVFRAPQPLPQGGQGVYYRAPDGTVTRLADDLPAPNGVLLSRDEKTLYVLPSMSAEMLAYPVEAPGKIGPAAVFCTVQNPPDRENGGCDGATVDELGNVYLTTALGVQGFSADGEPLGVIEFPEQPSNCTFGGADGKTLYVTARTSVYAAPMLVAGHRYATGEASADPPGTVRIRVGSTTPITDSKGRTWLGEEGFSGGQTISRPGLPIEGTDDDELYRAERYSMDSFTRELPNGSYRVRLHFAETYEGVYGPGGRVFSFSVNGQDFTDFDVWERAGGPLRAYVETVDVEVTDGKLHIVFTPQVENPEINGIEIMPLE
ncbi:MAG TPA: SMP-30/gluconolactonase/LRE family protein [Lacipirellulaceae bacterium]|nr:SMP-30/gluconolactonase/LRE family protein [Lacipirellulaceae bacterium]